MLHFFRKIRIDLLASNKFYRYLKYGLGEIILVVIGILIAIQVDNWNEERKRTLDRIELIHSLTEELEIIIKDLEVSIKSDEGDLKRLNNAIRMIENRSITIPIDSVRKHISLVFYASGILHAKFPIYSMAVSTGRIDLIEDDTFAYNMAAVLDRSEEIEKLKAEHLKMAFSGSLLEIKEQYWEVYKPFEDRSNGFSLNANEYVDYIARPNVIGKIKNVSVLRRNIIAQMNECLHVAKRIVKNFKSQND